MARFRVVFLSISILVLMTIAGVLWAGLSDQTREDLFRSLGILTEVVHLVENNYVDELQPEALDLSLDAGLVEGVDVWASVVPSEEAEDFRAMQKSRPAYGLLLASRLGSAAVRAVLKGSPAESAGLRSWEVIEELDGVYTRGRPLRQIRLELFHKFRDGKPVKLKVVDRLVDEKRDVELKPTPWDLEAFEISEKDEVPLVVVNCLPKGAVGQILEKLPSDGVFLIDLRHLVWGDESEAAALVDLFTAEGKLAGWKGRRAGEKHFEATSFQRFHAAPIVMISAETEHIGEIVAEGLRRAGAPLVGATTMGHAPHMDYVDAGDFELYMPVGLWLKADGKKISGEGLDPDEKVKAAEEGSDEDPVLDRALEMAVQQREHESEAA